MYPGIDVVYYGNGGSIEFDFVVKPGADVSRVGMRFVGASSVDVGEDVVIYVDVIGDNQISRPSVEYSRTRWIGRSAGDKCRCREELRLAFGAGADTGLAGAAGAVYG